MMIQINTLIFQTLSIDQLLILYSFYTNTMTTTTTTNTNNNNKVMNGHKLKMEPEIKRGLLCAIYHFFVPPLTKTDHDLLGECYHVTRRLILFYIEQRIVYYCIIV